MGQPKVLAKNIWPTQCFGRKTFGPHTVLTKEHLSNTVFWPKNFCSTQCSGQKRFGQDSVLAKETFCPHSVRAKNVWPTLCRPTLCFGQKHLAKTIFWPKNFWSTVDQTTKPFKMLSASTQCQSVKCFWPKNSGPKLSKVLLIREDCFGQKK